MANAVESVVLIDKRNLSIGLSCKIEPTGKIDVSVELKGDPNEYLITRQAKTLQLYLFNQLVMSMLKK